MGNSIYHINKGINKSIEFRGLRAQYQVTTKKVQYELQSPFQPATVSRCYFAGAVQGRVCLYNDKLEPVATRPRSSLFTPLYK